MNCLSEKLHNCINRLLASLILLLNIMTCSCDNQQTLCFGHDIEDTRVPVRVVFDWSDCPEANPANMNLYLIPLDGRHYTRHAFEGRDGGLIMISPGHYAAVALNPDCDNVRIINPGRLDTFTIALRGADENTPKSPDIEQIDAPKVCLTPGYLWTAWIDDLEITGEEIKIKMSEAFCRYSVEIRHLTDSHIVSGIQGILYGNHLALGFSGPADCSDGSGLLFSLGKDASRYPRPNDKNIITPIDTPTVNHTAEHTAEGRFYGEFLTFGHCGLSRTRSRDDSAELPHSLVLRYQLGDGSTRYAKVDVTDQVHAQPTEECHILLDTLRLPSASEGNGGLDLSIRDWQTVYIDISANTDGS
ncbi:MAG: DUF5119 domain-containing protein [Muribaculaceae bacterium]|nr:DUF5119 domain-containing protein [Muribaculaceae bacterium]